MGSDQLAGASLVGISVIVFVYYTLWVIVTPFVDESHVFQKFFLPRHFAISIPAVLLILLLVVVGAFVGLVMYKSSKKKKSS